MYDCQNKVSIYSQLDPGMWLTLYSASLYSASLCHGLNIFQGTLLKLDWSMIKTKAESPSFLSPCIPLVTMDLQASLDPVVELFIQNWNAFPTLYTVFSDSPLLDHLADVGIVRGNLVCLARL